MFAPDLMHFFLAGYDVMQADPTIWCVSAWHDNGFRGLVNLDRAPKRLLRTGYFPGLGWLLTRKLYKEELEARWPNEHWDHWMRSETKYKTSKGRECLVPQVPRTFHHGQHGTFMSPSLHLRMFADIQLSADATLRWPASEYDSLRAVASLDGYESELRDQLHQARPLSDLAQLLQLENASMRGEPLEPLALWYEMPPRGASIALWEAIAAFVGLWPQPRRGQHNGVHDLWCRGRRLLLVNMRVGPDNRGSPYLDLAPTGSQESIFTSHAQFKRASRKAVASVERRHCKTRKRSKLVHHCVPATGVCRVPSSSKI